MNNKGIDKELITTQSYQSKLKQPWIASKEQIKYRNIDNSQ